jgi:DNA (cytosine-5)-methyltransferase 1
MATSKNRPIAVDLFAGAGGLSLGFEQAGFDIAAAIELDPIHCAVHEFNFPKSAVICADLAKISGDDIRDQASIGNKTVDVLIGGAPCQGFSMMGKRALDDPRNKLVHHFIRIARELNASYFVFENVKGLTVGKHRDFLDEVITEFGNNGFDVVLPYKVFNAAHFGVPQNRHRLFLVGARKGLALPKYPIPTTIAPGGTERELLNSEGPTVWDAIGDLPNPDKYDELVSCDAVLSEGTGKASQYARRLSGLDHDDEDFSHPRIHDARWLTSSMRTEHTGLSQRRFAETETGKVEPISRFLKLDPYGISNTLRAGTGSDKGAFTSPRPIHPYSPRCITVREAARLHSYPDWFRFHATKWHGFRQVGNSVPPLLGRAVAAQILAALNVRPLRPAASVELGDDNLLRLSPGEAASRYGVSSSVTGRRLRRADRAKIDSEDIVRV